ncbi:hypothetical protein [Pseudonocardia sp. GCM10023141]|uniref:hypothetical protein n=1 Tax=Pseudonocardia sp. GCM10023141 TaxID=3252653 RepID=UPI00361059E3
MGRSPVFVEHWADGDLLLPAPGQPAADVVLIDVKTITTASDPDRVGRWLWRLLSYAWLDTTDQYRIRAAGLYLARHGALITWPICHLANALLTSPDGPPNDGHAVASTAAEFRRLAERVIADETGHPPARAPR